MKRLPYFSILLIQLFFLNNVLAGDTSFVLLRIRGIELIPTELDNGHYLKQQLVTSLQNEWKGKTVILISSDDSLQVASKQINYTIEVNIIELHVNEPIISQQTRSVSRDVTTNTYKDEAEDLRKEHTTVYADLTVTEKSVNALLRLSIYTTKFPETFALWNEVVDGSFNWENKSATYSGSYQALGSKEIVLVKTKPKPAPKEIEVYKDVVRQCINKSSRKIAQSISP
jgi:hypothetical protein